MYQNVLENGGSDFNIPVSSVICLYPHQLLVLSDISLPSLRNLKWLSPCFSSRRKTFVLYFLDESRNCYKPPLFLLGSHRSAILGQPERGNRDVRDLVCSEDGSLWAPLSTDWPGLLVGSGQLTSDFSLHPPLLLPFSVLWWKEGRSSGRGAWRSEFETQLCHSKFCGID